ncbi:DUF5808 domain-containing protein [Halobacillus litoralis]|uniref:DUF1648 domain-containing protein n=1 Tax=Halobacillus litoralis TaxID=45668 RepID=UPI001CD6F29D|nr:DUF5808 domain-containing protein [Halobacillus litoralis]MCA0971218.1 DUF5808 domain-containing protein [Halobacillus litoralis]
MNTSFMLLIFLVVMVPVFLISMFMPYWTRRTESFGVSIPERVYHTTPLKEFRKSYAVRIAVLSGVFTAAFVAFGFMGMESDQAFSFVFGATVLLYLVASFFVYLSYHKRMKAMKAEKQWQKEQAQRTVIDTSFRQEKLTYSNFWFLVPFGIAAFMFIVTFNFYDQMPERIPMQYNFEGEVTNWAEKSYRTAILMPVMQIFMTFLFLFVNTVISRAKQQVSAENPEESKRQNVIFRRRWSLFIIVGSIAMALLFGVVQWSFLFEVPSWMLIYVPLLFAGGLTIASIILAFTTGQGGSRVRVQSNQNGEVIDRDDDRYWKLGQFYFNQNDPAVFLEKRFGVGWTVNLARPLAWVFFLVIIVLAVGLPILLGG